jgi:hypothetical protein
MQSAGQNPVATTWLPRPAFTVSKTINPESREAATAQQIRGFGSAEDAGFEPARVLPQHDFQTCKPAVQRRQTRLTSDAGRECLQTTILYTDQKTT